MNWSRKLEWVADVGLTTSKETSPNFLAAFNLWRNLARRDDGKPASKSSHFPEIGTKRLRDRVRRDIHGYTF